MVDPEGAAPIGAALSNCVKGGKETFPPLDPPIFGAASPHSVEVGSRQVESLTHEGADFVPPRGSPTNPAISEPSSSTTGTPTEVVTRTVRMLVAYDGAPFHGFAENVGVATVAGTLRRSVERIVRHDVELTGAGRTDAGVHAWGQVVSVDIDNTTDLTRLRKGLNGLCGPSIVVREIEWAEPGFSARFSAQWRRYRYTVLNRPVPDPFLARTSWHVEQPLNLDTMQLACDPIIGEHDFSAFCRKPKVGEGYEAPSLVRRVTAAGWTDLGDGVVRFEIVANAFCHNQVRALVGTLVDTGLGRRTAGEMLSVLRSKDRSRTAQVAPPQGLVLWEVGY
jgi:tRNA pseudouridine38-40 synthase